MIVDLDLDKKTCKVTRQPTDPRFLRGGWTLEAESTFLYHVKQELQRQGYDVIKKRMVKDGHMTDETRQYIRQRFWKFAILNDRYMLEDAGEVFNKTGFYQLDVIVWNKE